MILTDAASVVIPSIFTAVNNSFSIGTEHYNFPMVGELPVNYIEILIIVLLALIIFGDIKRLEKTTEFVISFMAEIYILMAVIIIVLNIREFPSVIKLIFSSAFNMNATFSGIFGMTIA